MASIIDQMKQEVARTSNNRQKIFYVKADSRRRIRFLSEFDEAVSYKWHEDWNTSVNTPCREIFGEVCPYCDKDMKHPKKFVLPVYDYDTNSIQLMCEKFNNFSPYPAMLECFETYGTIKDRDYVISVVGKRTDKKVSVVPMDKNPFNQLVSLQPELNKIRSEQVMNKIIHDANPIDKPVSQTSQMPVSNTANGISEDISVPTQQPLDATNDNPYMQMTPIQAYNECMKRKIPVPPRKGTDFYAAKLVEHDAKQFDDVWGNEEASF